MRIILTFALACLLAQYAAAEDVAALREKGIAALKESESNPRAIVEAARSFAKAADLYVAAGDDGNATEMNSFLYWCKKKMALQDIEQFTKSGDTVTAEKLNAVEKLAPKADEAQKWLDRAERYAKENPNEHFLIATRFFEVASRFVGTKESLAAQERSLKEQGLSMAKAAATKPAAVLENSTVKAKIGKTINILALLDPAKDMIDGKWFFTNGVLVSDKSDGRIELPYQPPEEYDFKIVFMRMDGDGDILQIMSKANHHFAWIIDGWGSVASGIESIGGKDAKNNETTFRGQLIKDKNWHTSTVQVRNDGLTVIVDGNKMVRLATDYSTLGLWSGWRMRDASLLGLGHVKRNKVAFSTVELIEITGTGKKTR